MGSEAMGEKGQAMGANPKVSPLWMAARDRAWRTLEGLLDLGAQRDYGWGRPEGEPSALALLCEGAQGEAGARLAGKMMDAGADPMERSAWPEGMRHRGEQALGPEARPAALIALGGDEAIRAALFGRLSEADLEELGAGHRAARAAAAFGRAEWVEALAREGSLARSGQEMSALELAPDARTLEALAKAGADPMEEGPSGKAAVEGLLRRARSTPDGRAMARMAGEMASALRDRGGREAMEKAAFAALRSSAKVGAREAIAALGEKAGEAIEEGGWTLLHEAVARNRWADAGRLLRQGASPFRPDRHGETPFSLAHRASIPSGRSYGFRERTEEQEKALAFCDRLIRSRAGIPLGERGPEGGWVAEGLFSPGPRKGPLGDFWGEIAPRAQAMGWDPAQGEFLGAALAKTLDWLKDSLRGYEPKMTREEAQAAGMRHLERLAELGRSASRVGGGANVAEMFHAGGAWHVLRGSWMPADSKDPGQAERLRGEIWDLAARALADTGPEAFPVPEPEGGPLDWVEELRSRYQARKMALAAGPARERSAPRGI